MRVCTCNCHENAVMKNILLLLLVLSPLCVNAHTTLDPDFADQGTLIMKFDSPDVSDTAVAGITDYAGRYVSAGRAVGSVSISAQITRHLQDGTPDSGFGEKGVVRLDNYMGSHDVVWKYVAEQGRSLVAGGMLAGTRPLICRFTEDGQLDVAGFGVAGCRAIVIESSMTLRGLVVLADGTIVTLLGGFDENKRSYALAKLTKNGSIDTSFGDAECNSCGYVFSPSWMQESARPAGLAIDPSTEFLAVVTNDVIYGDVIITRTSPQGSLDLGFGAPPGTAAIDLNEMGGFSDSYLIGITADESGAIFIGTDSQVQAQNYLVVAKLRDDGSLDDGFGQGGVVGYRFPGTTRSLLKSLGIQPDGKILLAGRYAYINSARGAAVMRLMSDGSLDSGFGEGGTIFIPCADCFDTTDAFGPTVRYDDGRIVLFDTIIYPSSESEDEAERFDPVIYRIKIENDIFADSFD